MSSGTTGLPASPPFDPEAIPNEATLARGGSALRLAWRDGASATIPAEHLRLSCRCAWCTRDRVQDRFPRGFPGIAVTTVEHMGGYAVHIAFSDGHARGIFPWIYLRAIADEAADVMPTKPRAA